MKKISFILMLLLLLPVSLASTERWVFESEQITMDINLGSKLTLTQTGPGSVIDSVTGELLLYPKPTIDQEVINLRSDSDFREEDNKLVFEWIRPTSKELYLGVSAQVANKNFVRKVTNKIPFPLTGLPEETKRYLLPTKGIDSDNQEIIDLANELAKGIDDLYELEFKLASWVRNNINYSLDTLTADAVQTPSWVLENKYGVCDELTALLIALNRALGIPARYIAGVAYTNYQALNDWGPHAWAEVYFPQKGWIPFDIAYGQFGFVDASHIMLKESSDSDSTSTKYQWRGRNVQLSTEKLNIITTLKEKKGKVPSHVSLSTKLMKSKIGYGSYNLLEVSIKNNEDYYIITELFLAKPDEITIVGENNYPLLLKPKEERVIYWKLKLTDNLEQDYTYTFPLQVYTITNITSETEFKSSGKEQVYSLESLQDQLKFNKEEAEKSYSSQLILQCVSDKNEYYIDETLNFLCKLRNEGDQTLDNLNVCLKKSCQKINLPINQEKEIKLSTTVLNTGKNEFVITAENNIASKTEYVNTEITKRPKVSIIAVKHPNLVKFNDRFAIIFTLEKVSTPKNVTVVLRNKKSTQQWDVGTLSAPRKFVVDMAGRYLEEGDNPMEIIVDYKDNSGNEYHESKKILIRLDKVSFFERLYILFNRFSGWVERLI